MDLINDKTIITAIGVALVAAVTELYRRIHNYNVRVQKKLDACESLHEQHQERFLTMTAKLARLEGEQEGVTRMAQQVIQIVSDVSAFSIAKKMEDIKPKGYYDSNPKSMD